MAEEKKKKVNPVIQMEAEEQSIGPIKELHSLRVKSLPKERWLPVPGLEGIYEISNMGRIKGVGRYIKRSDGLEYFRRERICKVNTSKKNGYATMMFWHDSSYISMAIAPIVMKVFGKESKEKSSVIGYKDGDRTNLAISNLFWRNRIFPRKTRKVVKA